MTVGARSEGSPRNPLIPESLREEYEDWSWELVWQYEGASETYRLSIPTENPLFLKVTYGEWFPPLIGEAARMKWAVGFLPVPPVVDQGSINDVAWLVTGGLPGRDATDPGLKADPEKLVRVLARGLRTFHEAPVRGCPFDFRIEPALEHARTRLNKGQIQPDRDLHEEFSHLSAGEAIRHLEATRPITEDLVVCHGDYCFPNILIEGSEATGFVDLGELGVADRWWDLAVATWSVTWNLGPGYEDIFLKEYGVERDRGRVDFYRLLYDVVS